MITALDTSVLLDVFGADPVFGQRSQAALRSCVAEGGLTACEVVWTEVAVFFPAPDRARHAMEQLGVIFTPIDLDTALLASAAWKEFRRRGGGRQRVAADFLIGAHAQAQADRLLTRDRGFYRSYFSRLTIVDPTSA